jgi:glycolate oxidase
MPIVVWPQNEAKVVAVRNACRRLGVQIVLCDAGTGLPGGAMPIADGVILSAARLNKIIRLDPYAQMAIEQSVVRTIVNA